MIRLSAVRNSRHDREATGLDPPACSRHASLGPMGAVQIKNVPEPLHEALRARATAEGMTVSDYVLAVLRRDLDLPTQREWLARLTEREPVSDVDVVAALRDARAERGG
jgi:antitoxin FitA